MNRVNLAIVWLSRAEESQEQWGRERMAGSAEGEAMWKGAESDRGKWHKPWIPESIQTPADAYKSQGWESERLVNFSCPLWSGKGQQAQLRWSFVSRHSWNSQDASYLTVQKTTSMFTLVFILLLLINCVAIGKLLHLSVLWFVSKI